MKAQTRAFVIAAVLALLAVFSLSPTTSRDLTRPFLLSAPHALGDLLVPTLAAQGYSNTNPYAYWVPPGACNSAVSANGTGTNGLTTTGASTTPVVQAQTTGTGTNTHIYRCNISPPNAIITTGSGIAIRDAVFFYGIQTTGLGTQVAVLASGTMNGEAVFTTITYPAPGAAETPSTVTPARADAGTLVIAPVVASANVATTTAGSFYSTSFTPATPVAYKTDRVQLLLNVALLNTASSATVTQSPGVLVHFRGQ